MTVAPAAYAHAPAGSSPPTVAPGPTPLAASFNRETYHYTTTLGTSTEGNLYQAMVLQSTDAAMVPKLHAANPKLRLFVYMESLLSRPGDPRGWATCVPYATANAGHPDWFLKDQTGNRIVPKSYPGNYVMNVGNVAYQRACMAHAEAVAKQYGFDGVYLDDVTEWVGWTFKPGVSSPLYPTTGSWQSAESSLVAYAAPSFHAQHLLVIGNIGGATFTPGLWQRWNSQLDGAEDQAWTDAGGGLARGTSHWSTELANAAWSEANGKLAFLHSYNTTEAGNAFGLASMLLVSGGHALYSTANGNYVTYEVWYPEYTTAQQLGAPTGAYVQLPNGAYERTFANGVVLVNPTRGTIPSFSLGGGTYSGSGVTRVTSVSMAPTTGLVLLRVG